MNTIYITKLGYEKLKKELDELKNVRRKEIADRIEIAKDMGDLSENAEYHEAKDEQGFIEGRIAELEITLPNAVIIERDTSGCVNVGNTVRVSANGKEKEYTIVGAKEADPLAGRISNESPLGIAFIGKCAGDTVEVQAPAGKIVYAIISVS
jgi:transcription elongation factor GreA